MKADNNSATLESKRQILKSTGIVGISQVLTVLLQIVRTKIIAAILGPVGIGMLGVYNSIVELVRNITGLGINFSGVRDISQAVASNDLTQVAKTASVLKKCAVVTGLVGAILLVCLCQPISLFSFGDNTYSFSIALLGISVFFTSLSQSQIAFLQGTRNLTYMAKASVYGVLFSIFIITPIYWLFGVKGMVFAIICMSVTSYILSTRYVRKLHYSFYKVSIKEAFTEGREMIKLGIANSLSAIITTLAMYYVRSFISNHGTLDELGFFQASWSISNVYLLMVLNAMAADYFPRLIALNSDRRGMNKLVNEQTEIALLIGGPLVLGMYIFSHDILRILYSAEFMVSENLFNMFIIGSFFKIISWPICYIQSAKGAFKRLLISEVSWNVVFVTLIILLWNTYGLLAIGISYVISYIYYTLIILVLVKPLSNFFWSRVNIQHILVTSVLFVGVVLCDNLPGSYKYSSLLFLAGVIIYAVKYISPIINIKSLVNKYVKKA